MKERILEFLKAENKSSAQFAEEIGVQPSGISHILSGRNNPSLDFILKMLEKFPFISTDWLLFGKGSMYKDFRMQNLFDESKLLGKNIEAELFKNETDKPGSKFPDSFSEVQKPDPQIQSQNKASDVIKIVWFFSNNSFEEFYPRN